MNDGWEFQNSHLSFRILEKRAFFYSLFNFMHHHHSHHCDRDCTSDKATSGKVRLLWTALILVSCFSLSELAVSYWSHSLALQAESGHMMSDSIALGLSLIAAWIARLPSAQVEGRYRRIEVLAALVNGMGLVVIAAWIATEALARLQSPPVDILSMPMLITATFGLGVNSANALLLHDSSHHDLNVKGAFLHIVADLISSIGVILAAIAVWLMHWLWADVAISLFVSGLIAVSAIPLIIESLSLLKEKPVAS